MSGWGMKRIAKEMSVSTTSIRAARAVLVGQGKLAPHKQRMVAILEDIVEVGAASYLDSLERGLVAPTSIPVGVGIISDKRALALGEPTTIGVSATAALDRKSLSVEALNSWVSGLTIDMASDVLPPVPPQKPVIIAVDAVLDAARPLRACWTATTPSRPTAPPRTALSTSEAPGAGGADPEGWTSTGRLNARLKV
jgi:hypothetical protein